MALRLIQTLFSFFPSASRSAKPPKATLRSRAVLRLLRQLPANTLLIHLPDGQTLSVGQAAPTTINDSAQYAGPPNAAIAEVRLHNWRPVSAALRSGDIGFAHSYLAGDWDSPDLPRLLFTLATARNTLEKVIYGRWWGQLSYRWQHWRQRNRKVQAAKNIQAHYDLGNSFYALWLDSSWSYSAALFLPEIPQNASGLLAAQQAKVRRALDLAQVKAGDRVLEIGCGWGGLMALASTEYGAHVTGVTLSPAQLAFAQQRLEQLGVAQQTQLRLQDYRDIDTVREQYDAVVSIEMIEAVGRAYWPSYFGTIAAALKPNGRACIQSIVIADELFERYLQGTDFIQQYVFPGGCLLSPQEFEQQAARAGLSIVDQFRFGADYALTLQLWREQFEAQHAAVLAQGFDERFVRLWRFYLAYCEAGFRCGSIDVVQYTLVKAQQH